VAAGVLGGGIVAGIAVSQLGIASAASSKPGPRASGEPRPPMPFHRFGERLRGLPPFGPGSPGLEPGFGFGGHVLHSEATVEAPDGTTKVVVSQRGDITDFNDSTITVTSSDGFEATYTVDKNTRIALNGTDGALSSLKKGDTVHVSGTKHGSTTHADAVVDGMPRGFMMFHHDRRGGPQPSPSPNASASA
jgi:hypothetical protein